MTDSNPTLSAITFVIWHLQACDTYTDTRISKGSPMANREVNLTKRVQTPHGWRYCRVLLSPNGRVKPDVVVVIGKEERHVEGAYYLAPSEYACRWARIHRTQLPRD
jgi:hypothetical protein